MFLTRRLALWEHLEREQLPKEGLRYWFANEQVRGHADASETGGFLRSAPCRRSSSAATPWTSTSWPRRWPRAPSSAGRRAVRDVTLGDFDHRVMVERTGQRETVACRWVLDATGRATVAGPAAGADRPQRRAPHRGRLGPVGGRPARRRPGGRGRLRALARGNVGSRRLATNHYMGFGLLGLGHPPRATARPAWASSTTRGHRRLARAPGPRAPPTGVPAGIPTLAELLEGAGRAARTSASYAHLPYVTRQYMRARLGPPGRRRGVPGPLLLALASTTPPSPSRPRSRSSRPRPGRGGRPAPASPSTTGSSCAPTTASSRRPTGTSTTTWASTTCCRRPSSSTPRSTTCSW